MGSKTLITPEQYLESSFEYEPEYVHGELVERPLPNFAHGDLTVTLGALLRRVGKSVANVRMRLAEDLYRLPDLALFTERPTGSVPTTPPLLIVEINSPDDRMHDVVEK